MPTTFESYDDATPPGDRYSAYGVNWIAQTFTPQISHRIYGVRLRLARLGLPGTLTVSIRNVLTGAPAVPTGGDLISGTTNGDTLPLIPPLTNSELRDIAFSSQVDLEAGIQYAIVIRALTGDSTNRVDWHLDSSTVPSAYPRGAPFNSINSGATWTGQNSDAFFEEYGSVYPAPRSIDVNGVVRFFTIVNGATTYALQVERASIQIQKNPLQIQIPGGTDATVFDFGQRRPILTLSGIVNETGTTDDIVFTPSKNQLEDTLTDWWNNTITITFSNGDQYVGKYVGMNFSLVSVKEDRWAFTIQFVSVGRSA